MTDTGQAAGWPMPDPNCPTCRGAGFVSVEPPSGADFADGPCPACDGPEKRAARRAYAETLALSSVAVVPDEVRDRWQHVKRGTTYEEVGRAQLQNSRQSPLWEGDTLVVYRGTDQKLWARSEAEFMDGRFARLAQPAPEATPAQGVGEISQIKGLTPVPSGNKLAEAMEACNWTVPSISNMILVKAAIARMRLDATALAATPAPAPAPQGGDLRIGLEFAAAWHEARAKSLATLSDPNSNHRWALREHQEQAYAIRATLASGPEPDVLPGLRLARDEINKLMPMLVPDLIHYGNGRQYGGYREAPVSKERCIEVIDAEIARCEGGER